MLDPKADSLLQGGEGDSDLEPPRAGLSSCSFYFLFCSQAAPVGLIRTSGCAHTDPQTWSLPHTPCPETLGLQPGIQKHL